MRLRAGFPRTGGGFVFRRLSYVSRWLVGADWGPVTRTAGEETSKEASEGLKSQLDAVRTLKCRQFRSGKQAGARWPPFGKLLAQRVMYL